MFMRVIFLVALSALLPVLGQSVSGVFQENINQRGSQTAPPNPPGAQPQQAEPQKQAPPAHIEGTVANSATGEPLKRANIILMSAEPRLDNSSFSTTTDAAGHFAMAGIAPGKYRLSAERTGYVRGEYGARGGSRIGTTITLAPGQEMKQIEFRLLPHAVITGRVMDEGGEAIANVQVQAATYRYMQGKRQLMPMGGASTNDLGEYRIFGLPPGRYYVSATVRDTGMMWNAVDRTAGTRANQPEESYAATYYPGTNDPSAAMQLQVGAGKPLTNIDVQLVRTRTVRVRGRVANMGNNPMMRPMIMLTPRESGYASFERNMSTAHAPDGKFELRGVTPGAYYLIAQVSDGNGRQFARVPVDVGTADVDGIEITFSPGQEVTGTVRIESETQATPVNISIFLEPRNYIPMGGGGMVAAKEDGTFSIRNIVPDTYRVRAIGTANQFYVKSVYLGQEEAKDGEITVTPGTSPALSVVVSTAGGQVTGEVKGEKAAPVQGVSVVLVPDGKKRQEQALYKFATTDQYGKFSLTSIAPGEYKLFAWDIVEQGQWMDPDFLQVHENKGKSISIKENTKLTADPELLKNENP